MSKLIFDLKEKQLSFNSFEILNFERNKNSPSGSALRGKGSLFYAENFSYIDKIVIKFIIKKDNYNYNTNILNDFEKFKLLYSKYRIKGLVFLENEEIYEKIFPSIIFNKNQEFVKTAIKMLNRKESQLSDLNFDKLEEETKQLFFKLNMLDSFEQASKIFPNIKSFEFELLKEKYNNESLSRINPFLTCLHKLNFTTLPDTTDGFEIEMTLGIVKDIINYERDFLNSYREQEENFTNFFQEIENKIKSFSLEKNDLTLKFIDHDKQRMYLSESQENLNELLNASYLLEHDVFISSEDISQLQFITYNNIAEVPIQGYSSTMKQILGVGESNLTIRLLFKNNKNESFSKLKAINNLMNKEQRQIKGIIKFPIINSLDFKSVELSDFFYSNDSETDAVFATLILKVSCYSNQGVEINSFGETVDETLSANSKNRTANIPMIYKSFYHFNNLMINQDSEKLKQIKIDADKKVEFNYEDLINSYFSFSSIFYMWHQTNINVELSKNNDLDKYQFLINLVQTDPKISDLNQKCVDLIGLLPLIDFLDQIIYIGIEGRKFSKDSVLDLDKYKNKIHSVLKNDLYNKALVPIVNSMFPSIMANLEENNYYFVETVKICVLDFLVSIPNLLVSYLNEIKIDNDSILEIVSFKKILNKYYKEEIAQKLIKRIYNNFYNRLSDEDLINKIINSFNLNKIANEEKFSENNQPITIEQITKGVFDSLSRMKKEIESYTNSEDSKFFQVIIHQILSISNLRLIGYKKYTKTLKKEDIDETFVKIEEYKDYTNESNYIFEKIDFISMCMFSLLMNSFGISNSYFGMIHNVAAEKIIDTGIKSAMLNTHKNEDKDKIDNAIESLFGKEFCNSNNALSFYDELTSNIALTDLGSYLDLYAKDNTGEYKAIFNILLSSLVNDNYISKSISEYFKILGEESNAFYYDTTTNEEALENIYITNKKYKENGEVESLDEFLEREIKNFNSDVIGSDKLANLFSAQYNNKNSYLKNFNSKDLRTERIKSMTMGIDYLNQMNQLFTPNLLQTLPTYDIYILTNQNHYNATARNAIRKIEHYLGIDKVLSVDICFSEDTRMKTATLKVLDTSENVKPYNFKLESNLNIGLESVEDYAKNSSKTDFYSLAKQELNTGDKIVIYMGYCNNNELVFSGQISSIQEGKIKTIECVNNSYQLINKKFNLRAAENFPLVDPINTIKDIWRNTFDVNYEILKKTKRNSININQAFIPSNINNTDYNNLNLSLEQCSNYNMLFKGMAYNLDSMKEFTRAKPTNLAEMKTASTDWHNLDFYQSWWRKNKESLDSYFVQNINNVDRDISYYGIDLDKKNKIIVNGSTFTIRELPKSDTVRSQQGTNHQNDNKKFNPLSDDGVAYFAEDIDMKELLCDLEKRSPNTYWDVLDTFEGSTLFFGRPEYNILLKKKKTFYEFSKTERKAFLQYLEPYLEEINSYAFIEKYLIFYNAVSIVEGNKIGVENINPIDFENFEDSDYERAQNTIFAVTNKNLISCKISFNNSVANKIKINYASTLFEKLKNMLSLNTFMSTTLYSFGSMVDLDGLENYAEKLREKVVTDENIRTTRQSVESGFARLQMELEGYYDGKIIITFNPKVRYRSEIVIFDSVNNLYGSVLVKDFEHKFDSRGMYTIITPMMKISTMNTSRESFSNSYWTRLFYSKNREKTKANKNFTALNNMLNSNNSSMDLQLLNKLVSMKATDIPITMNNIAINQNDKSYVNLKTAAVQPLVFFPLMKRGEYLLPDKEIYSLQQRKHYELLNKYFARLGVRTKALFKFQKDYESNMDQNVLQIIGNYFTKRFSSLAIPKLEEIMRMNYESVIGNPRSNEIDMYRFEQVKKMMFKDLYDFKINETEVVENMFTDKNSLAFYNTKMLNIDSPELKKENIIKVINNFDFISLVEISDFSESKGTSITNVFNLANELVEKLNERKKDNSFEWKYLNPVLIREEAMTHGNKQANEYCIQLYKLYSNDTVDKLEKLEVFPSKTLSITVDISDHNNLEKRNIVINVPVTTINCKGKTFIFYSFHNIYFGNSVNSSTDTSVYRVKSMKTFFKLLDKEVKNSQFPCIVMGDFNISMFNHSVNSNQIYAPVIGEVLMIDEHGSDDLTVKGSYMTAMIKPNNLTTLGNKANKNSFENILINKKTKSILRKDFEYGVFYQAKYKSNKESIEFLSDHYPVYIVLK